MRGGDREAAAQTAEINGEVAQILVLRYRARGWIAADLIREPRHAAVVHAGAADQDDAFTVRRTHCRAYAGARSWRCRGGERSRHSGGRGTGRGSRHRSGRRLGHGGGCCRGQGACCGAGARRHRGCGPRLGGGAGRRGCPRRDRCGAAQGAVGGATELFRIEQPVLRAVPHAVGERRE